MKYIDDYCQKRKTQSIEEDNAVMDKLLEYNPFAKLLDIGCGDGRRTVRWAKCIGTQDITGMDAKNFGQPFNMVEGNIDGGLPFDDETFDVVISHHVIEHVSNTDQFVSEIHRVLKTGGYAGITTPNMAAGKVISGTGSVGKNTLASDGKSDVDALTYGLRDIKKGEDAITKLS